MSNRSDTPELRSRPYSEIAPGSSQRHAWSAQDLVAGLSFALINFEPFVPEINALNVFPVPDGDTGTNMYLTLQAAATAGRNSTTEGEQTVAEAFQAAAAGALMGARGNSGVILYQILEGLAQAVPESHELDGTGLAGGLQRAAELAYQAVVNPVEGTMLTVIRSAAEAARRVAAFDSNIHHVLMAALDGAERALEKTPELLPVLRQAGVIDAGGKGLVVIFDGLVRYAEGREPAEHKTGTQQDVASSMTFLDQVEIVHGVDEFGYCTNFLLTGDWLDVERFRLEMNQLGSSAVVVGNEQALKVHIHSEHPGMILEAALGFGELQDVRIDNMAAQTRKLLEERSSHRSPPAIHSGAVPIAVVAVANGEGLAGALSGMGANVIVKGGPTTNPSTKDILAAVERSPSDIVIILPNDPNVIAAARNVEKLTSKLVRVVPSRSVPQGIGALSAFNLGADVEENFEAMTQALDLITTISVTRASRDAHINDVRARENEYIGLIDGKMVTAGEEFITVALQTLNRLDLEDAELLTIFTGSPANTASVKRLTDEIEREYPRLTIEVTEGGQPFYDVIMAVE